MDDQEYTVGQVWSILVNGSGDLEDQLDVLAALDSLPADEREFIRLVAIGYPATYAMRAAGLRGNQTRVKRDILTRITRILNGAENEERG